jgi:predicted Rossmann fold nucleotide-binding protein DprA/Smf involved in DNA uptake
LPQIERKTVLKPSSVSNPEVIAAKPAEILSAVDQKIIGFISGGRVHIDDLISSTCLSSADILSALTTLELKGIVQQYSGKFFSLKK